MRRVRSLPLALLALAACEAPLPPPVGPVGQGAPIAAPLAPGAPPSPAPAAPMRPDSAAPVGPAPDWPLLASYPYHRRPDDPVKGVIPPAVRALDGRPIRIAGHMLPIEINDAQRVTTFLLTRYSLDCCYGKPPAVTEWIWVDVEDPRGTDHVLTTIEVEGPLTVGEYKDDYGDVGGLYRLRARSVALCTIAGHTPATRPGGPR